MKIEVAVTGPDYTYSNAVYLKRRGEHGDTFYRAGYTNHASKGFLKGNGAQFHEIEIPDWVSSAKQGIKSLELVADDLRDDWMSGYAGRVREAIDLIKKEVTV